MNRRKFIAGLLASAVMPAFAARRDPIERIYVNRVTRTEPLSFVDEFMEDLSMSRVECTLIYGTDLASTQFTGFTPSWSAEHDDMPHSATTA